jgi:hypothetical protein
MTMRISIWWADDLSLPLDEDERNIRDFLGSHFTRHGLRIDRIEVKQHTIRFTRKRVAFKFVRARITFF